MGTVDGLYENRESVVVVRRLLRGVEQSGP